MWNYIKHIFRITCKWITYRFIFSYTYIHIDLYFHINNSKKNILTICGRFSAPDKPKATYWSSLILAERVISTWSPFSSHLTWRRLSKNSRQFVGVVALGVELVLRENKQHINTTLPFNSGVSRCDCSHCSVKLDLNNSFTYERSVS